MATGPVARRRVRHVRLVALVTAGVVTVGLASTVPAAADTPAFGAVTTVPNAGTGTYAVAVADLDGDGTADIVSAELTSGVSVALGQGNRSFAASVDYPAPSPSGSPLITSLVVADVSGDGTPDVLATNTGDNDVVLWRGNGDGTLAAPTEIQLNATPGCGHSSDNPCAAAFPAQLVVADFDGDGVKDLATADTNTDNVSVLMGTRGGSFAAAVQVPAGAGPTTIAASDLDRDGHPDLVVGSNSGAIGVLPGAGDGSFAAPSNYSSGLTQVAGLQVADFDGDGVPDAVATDNGYAGQVAVLPGVAGGGFGAAHQYDAGTNPTGISVADVDVDGTGDPNLDLVIADNGADQVLVLSGDGAGGFGSPRTFGLGGGSAPQPVATGDVDGDLRSDIVTGNLSSAGRDVSVLFNSSPRTTQTTLTADSDASTAGDQVTYTATVAPAGQGTPDGTVRFTDGDTVVPGCSARPVTAGTATCTVTYSVTGQHSVTARYVGGPTYAASTSLAVTHVVDPGPPASLVVAPDPAAITAGGRQSFTAEAYDQYGNDVGDATAASTFVITLSGGGSADGASCTAASCTATATGSYRVTATDGEATGTAALDVTTAAVSTLAVTPADSTTTAGSAVAFSARGSDPYGNPTGDETGAATFVITPVSGGSDAGASCGGSTCSATVAGTYRIDASVPTPSGTATGSTTLTVGRAALASLTVSPHDATVATGGGQAYAATGADAYGNSYGDVTADATFTIDGGGSCQGATCSAGKAGRYTVTGTVGETSDTATLTVTTSATPAPVVSAISPQRGTTAGGTTVTITGSGLSGATAVAFGQRATTKFTITSDTQLVAVSPAGAAGVVDVTVTGPGGASAATAADRFTYRAPPAPPTVTSISPASGPASGGTAVTVTGTHFAPGATVSFGSAASTDITVVSSTTLRAVSPALAVGSYDVRVTTTGGTSAVVARDRWTARAPRPAISAITPTTGTTAGGTGVVVTGSGFTKATAVRFGSGTARFTVASDSELRAVSPAHAAGTVNVSVTTSGGTSTGSAATAFTYVTPAPKVTAVSPRSGPVSGGTTVSISGSIFTGATAVSFGNIAATSFTVVSLSKITAKAPAQAAGRYDITVTTPAGTSDVSAADLFTYVAPKPTITALSPTSGPKAGGTSVTVSGAGFAAATAVKFGTTTATTLSVASDTRITAIAPAHALGAVTVTITGPGGTSAASASARYTYR